VSSRLSFTTVAFGAFLLALTACTSTATTGSRRTAITSPRTTTTSLSSNSTGFATAKAIDAKSLYHALLNTKVDDSELPPGFSSAKVGDSQLSDHAKSAHAVGAVEVDVNGSDAADAFAYTIFPSVADATKDWDHGKPHPVSGVKITATQVPPGFAYPAVEANGSITGTNAFGQTVTNGASNCAALVGQVVVSGITASTDNTDGGNVPVACELLKAAIAHLLKITPSIGS